MIFVGQAMAGDFVFTSKRWLKVDASPHCVRAADLNNDGHIDLVSANRGQGNVMVFFGNGDGTFQSGVAYPAGARARDLAIADYDGDNWLDLAVANEASDSISVLLNNGDGTFPITVNYLASHDDNDGGRCQPWNIESADYNLDGSPDLAVTVTNRTFGEAVPNDKVYLFLNNGNGTFQFNSSWEVSDDPRGLCAGDFDKDGHTDLAIACRSDWVDIFWNNGDTTFARQLYADSNTPVDICAADFDGDSYLDFATITESAQRANIILNDGSRQFTAGESRLVGESWLYDPWEINFADMDGDGDEDLLFASRSARILPNYGLAHLGPQSERITRDWPRSICAADFDGDGDNDLAVATAYQNYICTWENTTPPNCPDEIVTIADAPAGPTTGDGGTNLEYTVSGSSSSCGHGLEYRFHWGDGSLSAWSTSTTVSNMWPIVGTYDIIVKSRCVKHKTVEANWSTATQLTILTPDPCPVEYVSIANSPIGPVTGEEDRSLTYKVSGAISSCGHDLQYRFNWGDGSFSTWTTIDSASHSWMTENTYNIIVKARCKLHPNIEANWSPSTTVTITASEIDSSALAFGDPLFYPVGDNPYCVRSADLDNDGLLDLVSANYSSGTVSVLLGNGNLTFQEASSYTSGSGPRDIAIADYNGDQYLDLAVANWSEGSISVLINNGNATFAAPVKYPAIQSHDHGTNRPLKLAAGDFNGDGYPDIVVPLTDEIVEGAYSSDRIILLMNNGDGTFAGARNFNYYGLNPQDPNSVCTGDFNRDGYLDFAALFLMGGVRVYYGNGESGFSSSSYSVGSPGTYYYDIFTSDLDGDGDLDFTMYGLDWDDHDVATMKNDGAGHFSLRSKIDFGIGKAIYAADMDADDDNDIIVATGDVLVFPNAGAANPRDPVNVFSGGSPRSVCAADFDGDGDNDLAIANTSVDAIVILPNTIGETPREELFYPYEWSGKGAEVYDIIASDFDGDTLDDLAFSSYKILTGTPTTNFRDRITVLTRDISKQLTNENYIEWDDARNWYNADDNPFFNLCAGDFNGDGANDIAASEMLRTLRAMNQGTGSFGGEGTVNYIKGKVCSADLNKDGNDDLMIATGTLYAKISNGDGSFADSLVYGFSGTATDIKAGDLNNDEYDDLVIASSSTSIFFSNGDGTLASPATTLSGGGTGVCIADLDNDGWSDIATCGGPALMSVRLNNGDGTFHFRDDYSPGATAIDLCTIDMNNDGFLDLAVIHYTVYEISLYINDGAGTFTFQNKYPVGPLPRAIVALDYDDDGDNDLVVACHGGFSFYNERGGLSILLNKLYDQTAADDETDLSAIPINYNLSQNYPNPFNPATTIEYSLTSRGMVSMKVYNILGRYVKTLVDAEAPAGSYTVQWDGTDNNGHAVATGIYFYLMRAGDFVECKKMLLLK